MKLHICLLLAAAWTGPARAATVYLNVKTSAETGQLKVWGSQDGKKFTYLVSSSPYMEALRRGHKGFDRYVFTLDHLPPHVRLGTQGQFLGRVAVDSVRAIVAGRSRPPLGVKAVGEVHDAAQAVAKDGRGATIVQRGQQGMNALELTFDPVPVKRPEPAGPLAAGPEASGWSTQAEVPPTKTSTPSPTPSATSGPMAAPGCASAHPSACWTPARPTGWPRRVWPDTTTTSKRHDASFPPW